MTTTELSQAKFELAQGRLWQFIVETLSAQRVENLEGAADLVPKTLADEYERDRMLAKSSVIKHILDSIPSELEDAYKHALEKTQ